MTTGASKRAKRASRSAVPAKGGRTPRAVSGSPSGAISKSLRGRGNGANGANVDDVYEQIWSAIIDNSLPPETRLVEVGPRRAVLVKRFDRSSGPRFTPTVHFLSTLSLLNGDETSAEGSYFAIAAEILRHGSRPDEDLELFRRMVFNVLCGNRDDHLTMARCLRQIGTPSQI